MRVDAACGSVQVLAADARRVHMQVLILIVGW
jgi:hypothetical protein